MSDGITAATAEVLRAVDDLEAVVERVDADEGVTVFGAAEGVIRDALNTTRLILATLREDREVINARIRSLVAEEEYLTQAARVFDRAAKVRADEVTDP